MNAENWQKIDSLFDEYLDSSPEIQASFFAKKDLSPEIKTELIKLISAVNKTDSFIETTSLKPVKEFLSENEDSLIGKKIGSYQLEKLVGKGGNGAVYLAKRIDDFSKEVAIKLIPTFSATKSNKDNFRRERQILARLEHENIAQILDGGTTSDGTPYLVMEFIKGVPLDEFCRQKNLSLNERLQLFEEVCKAVSFAHQNLVVHRDLKPNNILVDRSGKVKLLDFGIAKLLQPENFDFSENKTLESNALTPEYASPEQINGGNITTASDVYSLGVVLYELLTGKRPFDFSRLQFSEILQISRLKEAIPPSAIQGNETKIQDPEIDAIVLKALAKSPGERYQTVEELRQDINNYLNGLPISAQPQTAFYRFGKYISRHKLESIIAAVFIMILMGWFITAMIQTNRAERQAKENLQQAYSAEMILAANEYENANLNQLREILDKYNPQNNNDDLRGFEWYFLNGLLNPISKIGTLPHTDEIWTAEFSPDGKLLATAVNDNSINIWNLETKQLMSVAKQKGAWKIAFFPDGKRLAVSSSSNSEPFVKIYETENLKEVLTLRGHTKRVRALDVSPNGKIIATGSMDGSVIIWDAETGSELQRFTNHSVMGIPEIFDLQFSKDSKKLAVSAFEKISLFDTKTWSKVDSDLNEFIDKNVPLQAWKIVFSPLEKTIAIGTFSGDVVILDAQTLKILRVLKLHQANVKTLAFSSDGKILATGSWDRIIKFIDVQTGEVVNELRGHFAGIHEIAFSPDDKIIATASGDLSVNLWETKKVLSSNSIPTVSNIANLSTQTNRLFTWSNATFELSLWELTSKKRLWSHQTTVNPFCSVYSSKLNKLFFGDGNGFLSVYNAENGKEIKRIQALSSTIYAIAISPDSKKVFVADENGNIKAFDAENLAELFLVKPHSSITKTLDVSSNGKILASGNNDKSIKLTDTETGNEIITLNGNTKPLYVIAFSANGEFLAGGGADDIARIWRVSDGKLIHSLSGMSGGIFALAFSPDGKRLATSSDLGIIRLWNTETGAQVLAFPASRKIINHLWFSEDGKTLMSFDANGKLSFWESQ